MQERFEKGGKPKGKIPLRRRFEDILRPPQFAAQTVDDRGFIYVKYRPPAR